jgi:hypothetical protein
MGLRVVQVLSQLNRNGCSGLHRGKGDEGTLSYAFVLLPANVSRRIRLREGRACSNLNDRARLPHQRLARSSSSLVGERATEGGLVLRQVLSRCAYNKSEHIALWLLVRCEAILSAKATQPVAA